MAPSKELVMAFHYVKYPVIIVSLVLALLEIRIEHLIALNILTTTPFAFSAGHPVNAIVGIALAAAVYRLRAMGEAAFWVWVFVYSVWNIHFAVTCTDAYLSTAVSMCVVPIVGALAWRLRPSARSASKQDQTPGLLYLWAVLRLCALLTIYTRNVIRVVWKVK